MTESYNQLLEMETTLDGVLMNACGKDFRDTHNSGLNKYRDIFNHS